MRQQAQPSLSEKGQQALAHYAHMLQQVALPLLIRYRSYLQTTFWFISIRRQR